MNVMDTLIRGVSHLIELPLTNIAKGIGNMWPFLVQFLAIVVQSTFASTDKHKTLQSISVSKRGICQPNPQTIFITDGYMPCLWLHKNATNSYRAHKRCSD